MIMMQSNIYKWWSSIRWFIVIVLFAIGMLHMSVQSQPLPGYIFIGVFFGIVVLNLLYKFNTKLIDPVKGTDDRKTNIWFTSFQIVLDIIFATMVVHLTGGVNSYFVWIYLIGVITASLMVPQLGGLLAGLIGSASLISLVLLYQYKVLTPLNTDNNDVSTITIYLLSYTALFCGVALIANYISDQISVDNVKVSDLESTIAELKDQLKKAEGTIAQNQKKVEQSANLIPISADIAHIDHDLNTPLCIISLSIGRIKRLGMETNDESMLKTSNEITEAINKINHILQRLIPLKVHPLIRNYEEGQSHE